MLLKSLALPICNRYVEFLFAFPESANTGGTSYTDQYAGPIFCQEVASWFESSGPSCLVRRLSQQCQEILSVLRKRLIFPIYDKGSGVDSF